jgi:hypothetical protein
MYGDINRNHAERAARMALIDTLVLEHAVTDRRPVPNDWNLREWNDDLERTKQDVIDLYRATIARLEATPAL